MNNVFVYCEMDGTHVADVSLELLTKGRKLANELGCQLEAICAGSGLADVERTCRCRKTSASLRHRPCACVRCSRAVPLHFPAPYFYLGEPLQGRKASNLPDGRNGHRTRLGSARIFRPDQRTYRRLYPAGDRRPRRQESGLPPTAPN